jgi:cyclophilin family peptidyl-prolyl cis-trans isomerase
MRPVLLRHLSGAALPLLALLAAAPAAGQIGGCTPDLSASFVYVLETDLGAIPIELYPAMAPATVANFTDYALDGDYDGTVVHRSVPGFVIQGGGFRDGGGAYLAIPTDPPLVNEPCLSNTRGTVAMARVGGQPNSATSQWFVNLADNTSLDAVDGGFTVFGRVVGDGMDVADAIAALPRFDALVTLELPYNQILRQLPVKTAPVDPPQGYGCSRASPLYGLAQETVDGVVIDPLRNGASTVVPILLDPQCTGSAAPGPPSVSCNPSLGREVFAVSLFTVPQQLFFPRLPMSCAAVAESEASWATRRAGTTAQLLAQDVEIGFVPEPSRGAMLAVGALAVALLAVRPLSRRAPMRGRISD